MGVRFGGRFSRNSFFTVTEENDDFARNGDRHYTQGARIAYTLSEERTPDWVYSLAHHIPALGMDIDAPRFGLAAGQNIYTPANLFTTSMIGGDRPYAGYLYFGLYIQRRGSMGRVPVLDTAELDVGLIGPDSFAETTQRWWHGIGDWVQPQGWNNQLPDGARADAQARSTVEAFANQAGGRLGL